MSLTKEVKLEIVEKHGRVLPTLVRQKCKLPFSPDESTISRSICGRIRRITIRGADS